MGTVVNPNFGMAGRFYDLCCIQFKIQLYAVVLGQCFRVRLIYPIESGKSKVAVKLFTHEFK